eukprot:365990-Chlamydomonas_euryale.AAC.25
MPAGALAAVPLCCRRLCCVCVQPRRRRHGEPPQTHAVLGQLPPRWACEGPCLGNAFEQHDTGVRRSLRTSDGLASSACLGVDNKIKQGAPRRFAAQASPASARKAAYLDAKVPSLRCMPGMLLLPPWAGLQLVVRSAVDAR